MSASATPISAELFALAIKDLPASSLHFKARELRNSIAHLDYSNQQLLPYTDGTNGDPDPDCIDAIKENEIVIERHNERLGLLRVEVEGRGLNWREFMSSEELEEQQNETETNTDMVDGEGNLVNGHAEQSSGANGTTGTNGAEAGGTARSESTSSPWTDGTFTTGTISNRNISMDTPQRIVVHRGSAETSSLTRQFRTDAEIRRAMMDRMDEDAEEGDGLHL